MDVIFLAVTEDAKREAARQYGHAIERHFEEANRLLLTDPDAAEKIAIGAADLRRRVWIELGAR